MKKTIKLAIYNASYFEGVWWNQFWKEDTSRSPFKTSKGIIEVETMHNHFVEANYFQAEGYKGMDIDYADEIFCMRIILPHEGHTISEVIQSLSNGIVKSRKCSIFLSMPKFKIRYRIESLKNILQASGLGLIFNDPSCLTSITSYPGLFKETELSQETVIECDEYGTKAAAVTGMLMATSTGERIEYTEFKVDHPFIFSILEKKSGAVMFAGIVNDPT